MNNDFNNPQNGNENGEVNGDNTFVSGDFSNESSTYYYDYTKTKNEKKKKKSSVFPVVSFVASMTALVLAVVLVVASMSSTPPSGDNGRDYGSGAVTNTPKTETEEAKKTVDVLQGTVVYNDDSNWINKGNIVSDDAIVNATYKVVDTVVAITVTADSLYGEATGAGSGVIIAEEKDAEGNVVASYIVTNHHVIDGAKVIKVTLTNGDVLEAERIGSDAQTDIGVIKVKATGLRVAALGDSSKILLGETVVAIGNPLGELANTVTNGIISGLERDINVEGTEMKLLQTNAEVSPGNSGGGLFNLNGELIGIVNAKSSGDSVEGLGFAIPVNTAKEIADDIIMKGYVSGRCQIGVSGSEVTSSNYNYYKDDKIYQYIYDYYYANSRQILPGFYITDDSNVNYAGEDKFQYGDIIAGIAGIKVSDGLSITSALMSHDVGDTITVTVYRLVETETTRFGQTFKSTQIKTFDISVVLGEKTS